MVTLASEEARQFQESGESGFKEKCKVYFGNKWNIADASAVLFLGCGFILRFFPSPGKTNCKFRFKVLSGTFWQTLVGLCRDTCGYKVLKAPETLIFVIFIKILYQTFLSTRNYSEKCLS